MAPEKTLLRRVGKAIHEFRMIRDGDRIAVGVSGGKDSLTLLEALLLLQRKSPAKYTLHAFTVEQGKFTRPIEPLADYLKTRNIPWAYYRDEPSFRLLADDPTTAATCAAAIDAERCMRLPRLWERTW